MADSVRQTQHVRLADLLASLSLMTDLGMGHPPEEAMRTCLLATGLARRVGLGESDVADIYWTSLVMHVGCTAFAREQAAVFGGDEIRVNAIGSKTDFGNPRDALSFMIEVGRGRSLPVRARILLGGLLQGSRFGRQLATSTCEVAVGMAPRLGLSSGVQRALGELFERWDGKGDPNGLRAEEIVLPARYAQLSAQATVFHRLGGEEAALEMARRGAGAALDPRLTDSFLRHASEIFQELDACDPLSTVLEAEPKPQRQIRESEFDEIARAFADAVDLKSPYTLGHSAAAADLAEAAGRELGLPNRDLVDLRRAAYLHDLGRVGVPIGVLEKPGTLTTVERELVRLHPYHSERILLRSPALSHLAPLVGMHHERLDGSGYYRGIRGPDIPAPARVLAAADDFQGMTQERAHRPARSLTEAARKLIDEARAGRLDGPAVEAVLSAAGEREIRPAPPTWPAGLTNREVEVLGLLARGLTNREAGRKLFISPKTVGHHVEHIYQKIGVSSRAAAAMFAARHDLLQ